MTANDENDKCGNLSVKQALREGRFGRSRFYQDLNSGRLKAKKLGRRTIILRPDWDEYLAALPDYKPQSNAESKSVGVEAGHQPDQRDPAGNGKPGRRPSRGGGR